jgi:hypothetical protein
MSVSPRIVSSYFLSFSSLPVNLCYITACVCESAGLQSFAYHRFPQQWDVKPWTPVEVRRRFRGTYSFHFQDLNKQQAGFCLLPARCFLNVSLTMKMEVVRSFETQVSFYQTTECHIPEDSALESYNLFVYPFIYLSNLINCFHLIYVFFVYYLVCVAIGTAATAGLCLSMYLYIHLRTYLFLYSIYVFLFINLSTMYLLFIVI